MVGNFPRLMERSLTARASHGKVRVVLGARQTGKSTLLRRVAGPEPIDLDLQDPRVRLRYEQHPGQLLTELEALGTARRTIVIDEIQKVPELLEEVQFVADKKPRQYSFLLTGSSARRLRRNSANLLPGRAHVFELFPLANGERKGDGDAALLPQSLPDGSFAGFPTATLEQRLLHGDLPGIATAARETRAATLTAYTDTYLQEEIRQEAMVRDVGLFAAFLQVAAQESGKVMNVAALSRTTGIAAATITNHLEVLVDTFVGYRIPAFGSRARRRVQTAPKFLFFDLGVRNAATGWSLDKALVDTQGGELLEQWVTLELHRRCRAAGRGHAVSYWRTYQGAEVDVVLETPKEVLPIEVKWTTRPDRHDAKHVESFLDLHAPRARRGLIVCRTPVAMQLSERVKAIPWHEL